MEFIDLKAQQKLIRKDLSLAIDKVLDHGQYILGPEVTQLEEQLARFVGVSYCISNANGTDALLLALMALDIGPGDEVITTPFSFFATTEVISLIGATPIFVDIDPQTYNLDPKGLESKISAKTKAIMPVSLYGLCADFDQINEIAARYKIPVIEDAAQSFGATYKSRYSCGLTFISCTSFFPSKPLGCYGDGGACFTNNEKIAQRLRELRTHGQSERYTHTQIGLNGRLDTLQAAILLTKFKIFPEEIKLRNQIGRRYSEAFAGFKTQYIPEGYTSVYAQYTLEVENRSSFIKKMKELGIPTAVHYPIPLHLQPVYADRGYKKGDQPYAENAAEKVVSLPMHPYLSADSQDFIIKSVLSVL